MRAPARRLGSGAAPPARPGSGAGPRRPLPSLKPQGRRVGAAGSASGGPTCQDRLPRVRQLGLPRRGRSGRQSARRGHGGREGGASGRPASAAGPSLLLSGIGSWRQPVRVRGAGRSRRLPGSAPRGPSRAPPPPRPSPAGKLRPGGASGGRRRGGTTAQPMAGPGPSGGGAAPGPREVGQGAVSVTCLGMWRAGCGKGRVSRSVCQSGATGPLAITGGERTLPRNTWG